MAGRNWIIFSWATPGAVVRYLVRDTSRIAISNLRIIRVNPEALTVSFNWKDYKNHGQTKEMTMQGGTFLRCFTRYLVPKGFRRIRYFGLADRKGRMQNLPEAPRRSIAERAVRSPRSWCTRCGAQKWTSLLLNSNHASVAGDHANLSRIMDH